VHYEANSSRLVTENAMWVEICIINKCVISRFSVHHSLHRAFRSLLTDRTNVCVNSVDMLKNKTQVFNI